MNITQQDPEPERAKIRSMREVLGWSQFRLAKESGIGRTRISLFESSNIDLPGEDVQKILNALLFGYLLRAESGIRDVARELEAD